MALSLSRVVLTNLRYSTKISRFLRCLLPLRRSYTNTSDTATVKSPELNPFTELYDLAPVIPLNGHAVIPIYTPDEFYNTLKSSILQAKDRIFLSALYIGSAELDLVNSIREALENNSKLRVHILMDCLRGTRGSENSPASLLTPLVRDFKDRVHISLYHTPDLTGILKRTLPQRFNEGIGLQHIKAYGFDNNLVLSGANLSSDYFTNRQDRYIYFGDAPELTDYFAKLLETISSFSYYIDASRHSESGPYSLRIPANSVDPVRQSIAFKSLASKRMRNFIQRWIQQAPSSRIYQSPTSNDTLVMPLIQMGPLGIRQDEVVTLRLLDIVQRNSIENPWSVALTSGYFNFEKKYKERVLKMNSSFRILTAAPEANGFFNSKGVSRHLPAAYTYIEHNFYNEIKKRNKLDKIIIEEYNRPGWTYHAKGLWCTPAQDELPCLTMVGSPNFGHRSMERDLEAQVIMISKNEKLRAMLRKELDLLRNYCDPVDDNTFLQPERQVPYLVRVATSVVRTML
ncbi:uncharacterized protein VTP21DRAFT_3711 [Calcarisporiella thermophila]|uniref:uncharacterized protein n=1 Tax=Calcarisporiella thermophila TaxID=911321 RepID=UPI0037444846